MALLFTFYSSLAQATESAASQLDLSLMDLIVKGGTIMIPIFLLLFLAIYIFFERLAVINRTARLDRSLLLSLQQQVVSGNVDGAMALLRADKSSLARIYEKGVHRLGSPITEIESGMESQAKLAVAAMEKNMSLLSAVATMAPMLGFLGTVFGMIKIFSGITVADNLEIGAISEGLYEKMVTSAAGLLVGIVAHALHVWLNVKIDRTLVRLEVAANEFIDFLYKPS
ncbi:MAG: MotA/TolQ/ExbB proton channel family protein [Bacteroidetes bacterium]|jgi:biopolymer transport protein ExbB|nr:MotA/TolQ/ExbB proton channel family protein [Bacteroidota bacterium]